MAYLEVGSIRTWRLDHCAYNRSWITLKYDPVSKTFQCAVLGSTRAEGLPECVFFANPTWQEYCGTVTKIGDGPGFTEAQWNWFFQNPIFEIIPWVSSKEASFKNKYSYPPQFQAYLF